MFLHLIIFLLTNFSHNYNDIWPDLCSRDFVKRFFLKLRDSFLVRSPNQKVGNIVTVRACVYKSVPTILKQWLIVGYPLTSHTYVNWNSVYDHTLITPIDITSYFTANKVPILLFSGSFDGEVIKWEQLQLNTFMYR